MESTCFWITHLKCTQHFLKNNIFYPLIDTPQYQGVRNGFSENCVYILNEWSLMIPGWFLKLTDFVAENQNFTLIQLCNPHIL